MANNPLDKVYLSQANLTTIAEGGSIASGDDSYDADENAIYLVPDDSSVVQTTGQSTTDVMSQKAVTDELGDKADKVSSATSGNFAGLDSNGNLTDSGKKASDFASPLSQVTDLTPTTQTLTLVANTRYALGTLTALSLTFPTTNLADGDEIIIEFISGSTATTLTLDNVNAIYNFSSVGADKFVELNAQYKVSISKWVAYSAETNYTAV